MYLAWIAAYHISSDLVQSRRPKPREAAIARAERAAPRAPQLIEQMEAEDGHRSTSHLLPSLTIASTFIIVPPHPRRHEAKANFHFHRLNVTLLLRSLVSA